MYNRGEISKLEKTEMRLKSATIGRTHGLPKTHKQFDSIPKSTPLNLILRHIMVSESSYLNCLIL